MAELVKENKMEGELRTYDDWNIGKHPAGLMLTDKPLPRSSAEAIAEYADYEDRVIVGSYPWLLRPVVRWLRRATRQ